MLHSIIHWPDSADLELWPFAVDHTVYLLNTLPRKDTFLLPNELYTKIHTVDYTHLQRSQVWGCPVYVLDPKLQTAMRSLNGRHVLDTASTLVSLQAIARQSDLC
jgi:hypothetical protein